MKKKVWGLKKLLQAKKDKHKIPSECQNNKNGNEFKKKFQDNKRLEWLQICFSYHITKWYALVII